MSDVIPTACELRANDCPNDSSLHTPCILFRILGKKMRRHPLRFAIMVAAFALVSCATTSPIPMGSDIYMLSQTSAGGVFTSMSSLKADVITRANAFAKSKGKVAVPLAGHESPAYPGHMPNFEYQFQLVDPSDPRAKGGALVPRPDVVVQMANPSPVQSSPAPIKTKDVYSEMLKLDDLRKRGLITDHEFEIQKAKLLSGD